MIRHSQQVFTNEVLEICKLDSRRFLSHELHQSIQSEAVGRNDGNKADEKAKGSLLGISEPERDSPEGVHDIEEGNPPGDINRLGGRQKGQLTDDEDQGVFDRVLKNVVGGLSEVLVAAQRIDRRTVALPHHVQNGEDDPGRVHHQVAAQEVQSGPEVNEVLWGRRTREMDDVLKDQGSRGEQEEEGAGNVPKRVGHVGVHLVTLFRSELGHGVSPKSVQRFHK